MFSNVFPVHVWESFLRCIPGGGITKSKGLTQLASIVNSISKAQDYLYNFGIRREEIPYLIVSNITKKAEDIVKETVTFENENYDKLLKYLKEGLVVGGQ